MPNNHLHPRFAIIGGGFSGCMLAVQLIRQAQFPFSLALINKSKHLFKGVAYGTSDPRHLLNVPAENMSAFPDDPDHFYRWIQQNEQEWRALDPAFKTIPLSPDQFFPRKIYGVYLESIWQETLDLAQRKGVQIAIYPEEAVDLEISSSQEVTVILASRKTISADYGILALGVSLHKQFIDSPLPGYIADPWDPEAAERLSAPLLQSLPESTLITLIGSGLTTLDQLTSLLAKGYLGKVLILSKQGKWPEIHQPPFFYPPFIDRKNLPATALECLRKIRREIKKAAEKGLGWQGVIDSLRSDTTAIWNHMPWQERSKIVRSLLGIWNRHRHRMPSQYLSLINRQSNEGRVLIKKGDVQSVETADDQKVKICYISTENKEKKIMLSDYLINCSGPELDVTRQDSLLVQNLLKHKFIVPDPLRLGIQIDWQGELLGEVKGKARGRLFAIGQILFGELLETTSVPELRQQCFQLAGLLLSRCHKIMRP